MWVFQSIEGLLTVPKLKAKKEDILDQICSLVSAVSSTEVFMLQTVPLGAEGDIDMMIDTEAKLYHVIGSIVDRVIF